MESFEVSLISKTMCGEDVATCRFVRPSGYDFTAGQYCLLGLETEQGFERKPFTLAGAPGDDWIEITTRLSASPFKRALAAMAIGSSATVSTATGRLSIGPELRRVAFLVGGVGITPAHSILRDAVQRSTGLAAVLFYGCRDDSCVPYREEFEAMAGIGVELVPVFEHAGAGWTGETGFITPDVVARHIGEEPDAWIVAGPPVMVGAMERVLDALSISADVRLVERFGVRG